MAETKLVLLGTGTPNAEPNASGPATAVVVDDRAYLVDFGPGVVRQCSKAYRKGITALHPKNLSIAFCTHLHTDHIHGFEKANSTGYQVQVSEIREGVIYRNPYVEAEIRKRSEAILKEIREAGYEGTVVNGQDLDVF